MKTQRAAPEYEYKIISGRNYVNCFKNLQQACSDETNSPHPKIMVGKIACYRPLTVRETMKVIVGSHIVEREKLLKTRIDTFSAIIGNEEGEWRFISKCYPLVNAAINHPVNGQSTYVGYVHFSDDSRSRNKLLEKFAGLRMADFYADALGHHPAGLPYHILKKNLSSLEEVLDKKREELLIDDPFWRLMSEQDLGLLKSYLQCVRDSADQDKRWKSNSGTITSSGQRLRSIGGEINLGMCSPDVFYPISFGSQILEFMMGYIPPFPDEKLNNGNNFIQVRHKNEN